MSRMLRPSYVGENVKGIKIKNIPHYRMPGCGHWCTFSISDLRLRHKTQRAQSGDFTEGRAINASNYLLSVLEFNYQTPDAFFAKAISEVLY